VGGRNVSHPAAAPAGYPCHYCEVPFERDAGALLVEVEDSPGRVAPDRGVSPGELLEISVVRFDR